MARAVIVERHCFAKNTHSMCKRHHWQDQSDIPMPRIQSSVSSSPALRRILVVEDNDDFRQMLNDMLDSLGHQVHSVACAEDAVDVLKKDDIDILLADINMPGMSGIDLAKHAVNTVPGIRVVFSSGFGYMLGDKLDFDFVVLHKPYFLAQLKDVIG